MISLTWQEYWDRAGEMAESLRPLLRPKLRGLWIPALGEKQGLLLFAAALQLGLDPVFDEKGEHPASDGLLISPAARTGQRDSAGLILRGAVPSVILREFSHRTVWFCTSGSTGKPKAIAKSAKGLLLEVETLRNLYQIQPSQRVVSLVRPFHIYGFLHALLLPLRSQGDVCFWPSQQMLPDMEQGFPETPALVVMVPAHWRLLQHIWQITDTRAVVTSGAPFGKERDEQRLQSPHAAVPLFEIMGSTETGGIGFRRIDLAEDEFRLFPGVSLASSGDGTVVYSPYLTPQTQVMTADQFDLVGERTFVHRGRSDRIFKYAGVRHSLGSIEAMLSALCQGAAVVCAFHEDTKIAQGGHLEAWIESATLRDDDIPALRVKAADAGQPLFPHRVHVVSAFPKDAQGKLNFAALTHPAAAK